MKTSLRLSCLTALLLCSCIIGKNAIAEQISHNDKESCPLFGAAKGMDRTLAIRSGNTDRSYVLHLPTNYACNTLYPVIIGLHGYTGSGSGFQHQTADMFASINLKGYIGVFPNATESTPGSGMTSFNDLGSRSDEGPKGPTCTTPSYAYNDFDNCPDTEQERQCHWGTSCADDLSFLRNLIDDLQQRYSIDDKRIFLMGFSQGAQTAAGLACGLQDKIAAVIPVHGFPAKGFSCGPAEKVSLFQIVGQLDQTVNGFGKESADGMIYDSATTTASVWAEEQHCAKNGSTPYPTIADGYLGWQCVEHANCASSASIVTCSWLGDHIWPRNDSKNPGLQAIWEFLSKQSK